ncbi:MAG: helix-turn-helix domain-containing protein [bacterium]
MRRLARSTENRSQARRLLALAEIYDGATRTKAAEGSGVKLQTIRDWISRFNARGPDGLAAGTPSGRPSKLCDFHRTAIARFIESRRDESPWRLIDLSRWVANEFDIAIAKQTLSRELRAMGYRKTAGKPSVESRTREIIQDTKGNSGGRGSVRE